MANVTTMDRLLWPLMDAPSIEEPFCVVCFRNWPLNNHHVVYRSQGELYRDGRKLKKPTIPLCGSGNTSGCHGKAHHHQLHFKFENGIYYYLETEEPTKYMRALELPGWKPLPYYARLGKTWDMPSYR